MTEPEWIDETDIFAVHQRALAEHGGAPGLRDENLLLSALARPRQLHTYNDAADLIEMTVAYIGGIVRNHPFVDGNKRAGFVAGILFLELNGVRFTAPEADAAQAMLDLASGALGRTRRFHVVARPHHALRLISFHLSFLISFLISLF